MTFGEAEKQVKRAVQELVKIRKASGVTKYRLGELTGLSREAIRLIENGQRSPTLLSLFLICSALDIKLGQLLERADTK